MFRYVVPRIQNTNINYNTSSNFRVVTCAQTEQLMTHFCEFYLRLSQSNRCGSNCYLLELPSRCHLVETKQCFITALFFLILNNSAEVLTALRADIRRKALAISITVSVYLLYKLVLPNLATFREMFLRAVNRHSIICRRFTRKGRFSSVNTGPLFLLFSFIVIHSLEGFSMGFRNYLFTTVTK